MSQHPALDRLLDIVAQLRGPDGCPWDREQTLKSLKPYLIEEAYEVIDAIDNGDTAHHREELGDLLLQVALQAQIRTEQDDFNFDDVAHDLSEKLIRRHPHVFGDATAEDADAVRKKWDQIKAEEKGNEQRSILAGVPLHLPALQKAQRVQSRAARVGFDWDKVADVIAKVHEELEEAHEAMQAGDQEHLAEELGDLIFAVVNLSRFHGIRAEEALNATTAKFTRRFNEIETRMAARNRKLSDCTLEEMDAIWDDVKREERANSNGANSEND